MLTFLHKLPLVSQLKDYNSKLFLDDAAAGSVVAVMLIPQAMAYALLAGLPPVNGLYASTVPVFIYALFGSSRQLAVGPVAMLSLLTFVAASSVADPKSPQFIEAVWTLTLLTAIIQFLLGLLRMGFLVRFVSQGVISAFASAAAIVILLSQLGSFLGIKLPSEQSTLVLVREIVSLIDQANFITLTIGILGIGMLALGRIFLPKLPLPLVLVVAATVITYLLDLHQKGVKIVGEVAPGLPNFNFPTLDLSLIRSLVLDAFIIVFVGFFESYAVAQKIAAKEGYRIRPNQEFTALGLANCAAALFSGFPVAGGLSRTAVNHQAKARTTAASMITSILVVIVLLFLTPFFYYLPKTALASIIMVAVVSMIDLRAPYRIYRIKKLDAIPWIGTFFVTLFVGVETGIITGIGLSIMFVIWRSAYPNMVELGYSENAGVYRDIKRYPEARVDERMLIFRIDAALYFANIIHVIDYLNDTINQKPGVNLIIIDGEGINDVDANAVEALHALFLDLKEKGITLRFATIKGPVRDILQQANWDDIHPEQWSYSSIKAALHDPVSH
jgi:sulfate permease, SulP family